MRIENEPRDTMVRRRWLGEQKMDRTKTERNETKRNEHAATRGCVCTEATRPVRENKKPDGREGYREFYPKFSASYPDTPTKGC